MLVKGATDVSVARICIYCLYHPKYYIVEFVNTRVWSVVPKQPEFSCMLCDKWLQLSLVRDGDDVQAGLLKSPDKEYDSRQTEESKSRLHFLVYKKSSLLSLQQESIDHLHRLLCKCSADHQTLPAESRNCKEKLWQLQAIEEQLQTLQLTKDQVLPIYLSLLRGMVPNMLTAPSRFIMMHKSNDSVWLLSDGLDLLLPEILNVLLQQQTHGDIANQCPADKQEEVKLLKKFTSRLEVWQESLDKQQCLHRKLSNMFLHWPQCPWVRHNFVFGKS